MDEFGAPRVEELSQHFCHGKLWLVVSGSPCQGFSKANGTNRGLADERCGLIQHLSRLERALQEASPQA